MRLLVHGNGFKNPFISKLEEVRCGRAAELRGNPACYWSPSSVDWEKLGRTSGGSTPAATIDDLLAVLSRQETESIEELRIIGHSNGDFLALGGTIQPTSATQNVVFAEDTMIGSSKAFLTAAPKFRALQSRLKADARIVLAGCVQAGSVRICSIW